MTFRHSSLLLLIASLLLGFVWVFEHPFEKETAKRSIDRRLFPEIDPQAIESIELRQADQSLQLNDQRHGWQITKPISYPAEDTKVTAFIEGLTQLSYQSALPATPQSESDGEDLYGLNTPSGHISVAIGSETYRLDIGSVSAGNITFVRRGNSEQIFTLPSDSVQTLDVTPDNWRDPRVFTYPDAEIEEIQIVGPLSDVRLQRDGVGTDWRMMDPHPGARLDNNYLTFFLQQLTELRADSFHDKQAIPTQVTLNIGMSENRRYTLNIQAPYPKNPALVWATLPDSNTSVTLNKAFIEPLADPEKAFRSTYLLDPGLRFDTLTINGEETFTVSLDHESGQWWLDKDLNRRADNRLVALLQKQLVELRINTFVTDKLQDESAYGLTSPFRSYTFALSDKAQSLESPQAPIHVRFGHRVQNLLMSHRSDERSVYGVPYGAVFQLPSKSYQLRDRRIWTTKSETIERIRVIYPDEKELTWNRVDDSWQTDEKKLEEVESAVFQELINQLLSVKAEAWTGLGERSGSRFGIGKKARLIIESSAQSQTLQFGSVSPRGHLYAATEVDEVITVFEFPGQLYVKLNQVMDLENQREE